jgi:anaerobic selenocysteine-containing dehydrogenase
MSRKRAGKMGIDDDDWVYVSSSQGRLKAQVQLMEGVNEDTVWTWNAIGKRRGAWNLSPDAPEGTKGFLLNHIISQLLPEKGDGYRYANSDPVTGQAAWFDLRVKIEKAGADKPGELSEPQFEAMKVFSTVPRGDSVSRYGGKDK